MKYYENGRCIRESAETDNERVAADLLAQRVGRIAAGEVLPPRLNRVTYDEARADLVLHYETTGERDLVEVSKRLAHLDPFFTSRRLLAIKPPVITEYVATRQAEGAANGTINRELAVLGKLFRLAVENEKATAIPIIRKLTEAEPRKGFVEPATFEQIARGLPEPVDLAVRVMFTLAWRSGEVLTLQRRHVDLGRGLLRRDPGETKNGRGREAFMPAALLADFRVHMAKLDDLQRRLGRLLPDVFIHMNGRHAGRPIGSFRKVWARACKAAGVPGLLVHDLRRSGVRRMVRAGIPETVAMAVSGHRTRSVFDRYNITSEGDLREAARRLALADGHSFGHNRQLAVESRSASS
jgi:integrase